MWLEVQILVGEGVFFKACNHHFFTRLDYVNLIVGLGFPCTIKPYLVVFAMPVDHPVLPVGADLQFEGGDVVRLLCLFGNGPLCGDARQNLQKLKVNLEKRAKNK